MMCHARTRRTCSQQYSLPYLPSYRGLSVVRLAAVNLDASARTLIYMNLDPYTP
jgi:hypothetical protein